jgi:predicted flap endonuclease-1-like 5' DNA nuclease
MDTTRLSRCQATCWSLSALTGVLILWASASALGVIGALIVAVIVGLAMALLFTRLVCTGHSTDDPGIQPGDIKEVLKNATGVTFYKAPLDEEDLRPASPVMSAPAPTQAANNPGPAASDAPRPDVGTRPEKLSAPRGGQADDLKQIKGIGPKLEALCHELGFYHFDQIARWTEAEVAWVDENLTGFNGRVSRDDWVAQAKTLAAGGETEFSRRQGGTETQ